MTLVAHVTDLHLCEPRPERRSRAERLRLATLNLARPIDPEDRKRRALAALERARDAGAEHVVVTGDLTEDSHPEQFEVLADVLWRCRIPPQRLTLVPGNHDLYTSADAWDRALDGPLGPYASTSRHGAVAVTPEALVVAVSTAVHQPFTRSAGATPEGTDEHLAAVLRDRRSAERAVIAAMHHPPYASRSRAWHWIDGLDGHERVGRSLLADERLHALFGHIHRELDRPVRAGGRPRVFAARAVLDDPSAVRFYRARGGRLHVEAAPLGAGLGVPTWTAGATRAGAA
jgi:Icc protein